MFVSFCFNSLYRIEGEDFYGKTFEQVPDIDEERNKYDILKWTLQVDLFLLSRVRILIFYCSFFFVI